MSWFVIELVRSGCHVRLARMTTIIKVVLVQVVALAGIELSTLSINRATKLVKVCALVMIRDLLLSVIKLEVIVSH